MYYYNVREETQLAELYKTTELLIFKNCSATVI